MISGRGSDMKKKKPGKPRSGIAKALEHPAFHQRVKPGKKRVIGFSMKNGKLAEVYEEEDRS